MNAITLSSILIDGLVRLMITSMIFFPDGTFYEKPEDYHFQYEEVSLTTEDRASLFGWYLNAQGEERGTVLFLHGNAGNVSHRLFKAQGWVSHGFSVFLVDYRGYGKSRGSIHHQKDLLKDAQASLEWLRRDKHLVNAKIILYGESLGTWPAVQFAAQDHFAAVILEAPFTSFPELAKKHYAFVPQPIIQLLLKDFTFSNIQTVGKLKTPLFIMHGTHDQICQYEMGLEIFEKAPEPKEFYSVQGGDHNDLPVAAGEEYWKKPLRFVLKQLLT
jgi:alpha-beta hydrolase superfamily lysophospholipase